jgi:hypothetical protein
METIIPLDRRKVNDRITQKTHFKSMASVVEDNHTCIRSLRFPNVMPTIPVVESYESRWPH